MEKTYYSGRWYLTIDSEENYCEYGLAKDFINNWGCPIDQQGSIEHVLNVLKGQKKIDEQPQFECLRPYNADVFKMYDEFMNILNEELKEKIVV